MTTGSTSLLKLSMVVAWVAYYCLGQAVPKSDGVREEGSMEDLGSGKSYKVHGFE